MSSSGGHTLTRTKKKHTKKALLAYQVLARECSTYCDRTVYDPLCVTMTMTVTTKASPQVLVDYRNCAHPVTKMYVIDISLSTFISVESSGSG